jgi:hypothetical protein
MWCDVNEYTRLNVWKMGLLRTTKHVWWPMATINKKRFDFQETFSLVGKPCTIQTMLDISDT